MKGWKNKQTRKQNKKQEAYTQQRYRTKKVVAHKSMLWQFTVIYNNKKSSSDLNRWYNHYTPSLQGPFGSVKHLAWLFSWWLSVGLRDNSRNWESRRQTGEQVRTPLHLSRCRRGRKDLYVYHIHGTGSNIVLLTSNSSSCCRYFIIMVIVILCVCVCVRVRACVRACVCVL